MALETTEIVKAAEWQDAGLVYIGQAEDIEVSDQATLDQATAFLIGVRALQREIHDFMDPLVASAYDHHKLLTQRRATLLEGPGSAERLVKEKLVAHERRQRAAQEEAERQQREAIRKQQEEAQLRLAEAAEQDGDPKRAERILSGPPPAVLVPPVKLATPPTKATGVTYREQWSATVSDFKALVDAVAAGTVPIEYLLPNQQALDALARSLKDGLRVPGVEPKKELIAAGSGRR